ncbi:DUF1900-domain-containing protein [Violaceomyces palustris]|uniref:DUF1900-domain-containing protein n=1 Tax=Violaceomyces palustris TaxID=1673888 RepID=A0ACD0NZJ8_9BASI|nr:DUF1900-domain-containing protein [Violaceomyces palustris]
MPYSRFANVSKWRNAQATQAKPDQRYQELGLDLTSDSSSLLKVSSHWVIAKASSAGKLILLPNDQESTKKYAKQPPTFHTAPSNITDFDLSPFESQPDYHLASATSTGSISVHSLPYPSSTSPIVAEVPVHLSSFASPGSKPVSCLAYHPTSSGLLLSSAIDQIDLWDYNHQLSSPSTSLSAQAPVLSTAWSLDGRLTGATCKDGTLKIFDARSGPDPTASFQSHLSKLKPSRLAFVRSLLLSTGFSAMREREWAVWDPRALKSPLKRGTVDTSTGTLVPLVDQDRGLVFLSGRGDSNIRWIEVDDSTSFTEGQFPLGLSQIGAGIGPSSALRVMQGEIDRLYLATNEDSIVPVSITIPRRQYIDFHQDLYPPTSSQIPAQDSAAWLSGRDAQLKLVSQDPLKSKVERDEARSSAACLLRSESSRQEAAKENPTAPAYDLAKSLPRPDEHVDQPAKPSTADKPSQPLSTTDQVQTQHTAVPRPFKTGTAAPPPWSRRFLAGNTPLQAAYQNLTNIDVGMAPDSRMIVANSKYLLFPLAGPGGRLGVHPVSELGRMPTLIPCFSAPSKLVDFAVDPFDERRVVTAHDDGSLRVWILPENGGPLPAQNVSEPDIVMNSNYAGKISEIAFHPTTRNIVGSSSPEEDGKLLIWDLESGKQALSIPTLGAGSSSLSWSPDGGMVALAGRDKTLRVVAPDSASNVKSGSILLSNLKNFKLVWLSEKDLILVGHAMGSARQIKLMGISSSAGSEISIIEKATLNLDVSPAILFPHWDEDTQILWLFSKGERSISAFEIHPEEKDPFTPLPAFQHSQPQLGFAFLDKKHVDPRKVEIAVSFRLCKGEIQRVSWCIPRLRLEYFQDDIFVPTRDVSKPLREAKDWLDGNLTCTEPVYLDLCPEGMKNRESGFLYRLIRG